MLGGGIEQDEVSGQRGRNCPDSEKCEGEHQMLLLGIWEGQETLPKAQGGQEKGSGLALRTEGTGWWI